MVMVVLVGYGVVVMKKVMVSCEVVMRMVWRGDYGGGGFR